MTMRATPSTSVPTIVLTKYPAITKATIPAKNNNNGRLGMIKAGSFASLSIVVTFFCRVFTFNTYNVTYAPFLTFADL